MANSIKLDKAATTTKIDPASAKPSKLETPSLEQPTHTKNPGLAGAAPSLSDKNTSPLKVDYVQVNTKGRLGMALCPGKGGPTAFHDKRPRDLDTDLNRLTKSLNTKVLVTLIEDFEFDMLEVPNLLSSASAAGLEAVHFPIKDVNPPASMSATQALVKKLVKHVVDGDNIVIHCRGGNGRTGTIAACMLVELGHDPETAITMVRSARPKAIETKGQEDFILAYTPG